MEAKNGWNELRGYNPEPSEANHARAEQWRTSSGTLAGGNFVHPDVPSALAACDASIPGAAEDPRRPPLAPVRFRVLKVTQSYYPFLERGGSAATVHALARSLARRGHSVTVLTSDLGLKGATGQTGTTVKTAEGWQCDADGVEALYLSARSSYRSLTWNPGISSFCSKRLKSFDIVHIYGTYDLLGPFVARACRRMGLPYIVEPLGMFRPIIRNLALKWCYRRLLGEKVIGGAWRLIATSLQERQELIEEGIASSKITVRRNGIEFPKLLIASGAFRRRCKIPQAALLILFLGRIVSKKGPELLLEAFARWRRLPTGQTAILVFAGPAEEVSYLKKLETEAKRKGIGESVLFTGPLYGDLKWSALLDADIFVLPSRNENFGNAGAEAVACGTPVIVTDRCGIAPMIEGRAGLVIPLDCEALIRALQQLADVSLRERMKLGCEEVARGLGWEEPLAEMEALYAQALRTRSEACLVSPS